ncbi:TD and POZ domain-containing protein 4-like [Uloborus diversus]|uniref:TD and POZ domain-containing protein 4-like n=1 Tax=Uloborus diversus TaxID=327109 RepID=UPI002409A911|nr:TD and POZ domain-containing protein 4-like [Uloborus diversus]
MKKEAGTNTLSEDFQKVHLHNDISTEKDEDTAVLCADLETLHKNPRFADVILKLGEREFPAHKVILASRSKVFEAMFEHDMQEKQQDAVSLVEMEVGTVEDMLSYIYCSKVRQLSPEEALKLYVAADRYDLQGLVLKCRKIMLSGLSIDNICDISAVADLHNDELLIDAVKSLLSKDAKKFLTTDKWLMFSKENPLLALNLVQSVILGH